MKKITILIILICSLFILALSGCSSKSSTTSTDTLKITVTDTLGRQVAINYPVKGAVAIGPGSLRLYCYVNGKEKLVGVENFEKTSSLGRPYILAYPDITDLPVIGVGGPNSTPDAEKILALKPDVIFADSSVDQASAEALQSKTGIPVVVLNYGQSGTFDQALYSSINIIGKVMGQEERSQAVVDYVERCRQDLNDRVRDVPDNQKPSVYVGGLSMKGTHGIQSTQAHYPPLEVIRARNIADETGQADTITIDLEKLLSWNPDKMFIDEAGLPLVQQDYQKNPAFYKSLSAVKNNEIYAQMPFKYYTTNIDTAIADAYYAGKVLYPDQFTDINPEKKADEIYTFLVGKPVYSQMANDFGGFKKLSLE